MGRFRRPSTGVNSHPFRMNVQAESADVELFKDIFEESTQLYGDPLTFIRKKYAKIENTFGEHLIHTLGESFKIYGFVEQTEGWEGMGDMFSKFGMRFEDEMTVHISKNTFLDLGFIPMIGDVIFHDTSKKLWEIEYVVPDDEYNFHPLGQQISNIIKCKLKITTM